MLLNELLGFLKISFLGNRMHCAVTRIYRHKLLLKSEEALRQKHPKLCLIAWLYVCYTLFIHEGRSAGERTNYFQNPDYDSWPVSPLVSFSSQLPAPAEPLAALWRSRMTRWHSCLYRPDLTASAPSSPSRWPPSRGASPRRRLGDRGWSAAATATMKMGQSPTVTWRRGNLSPSSMGTSLPPWCPPLWKTWTPSTAIRRSVASLHLLKGKYEANECELILLRHVPDCADLKASL